MTSICLKKTFGKKGFTIIEALVLLFIFVVITTTFYRFFASGTSLILESKKKLIALNVANEKIEIIRSKPYGEINIGLQQENLTYGNYIFLVKTSIAYHDDEFDGKEGAGDSSPNDYKKVIVEVRWGSGGDSQTIYMHSIVAPFGEEIGIGGGVLSVSAVDIDGNPVAGVQVSVTNASPDFNQALLTNANGSVSFMGLTQDNEGYEITLSKSGYEGGVATLPPYPLTSYYPTNVHASVLNGKVTNSVFGFSRFSDFKIKFIDAFDNSNIPNVNFSMKGGRVLGTNPDTSLVYNYKEENLSSNSSGEKNIENVSPGQYTVAVNKPGYLFWKVEDGNGNNSNEIIVNQGESGNTKNIKLLNTSVPSYFVRIVDSLTLSPIEGVEVAMENATLGFSDSVLTDEYGYAFFPSSPVSPMISGTTYGLSMEKDGYASKNGNVTATSGLLTDLNLSLDKE